MTDITDPQVVAFTNVYLRPLMEKARDLQILLRNAALEYTTNIAGILSGNVNTDPIIDGRLAEGLRQLTKIDVTQGLQHLNAILTALNTLDQDVLRAKFTVRPPRVN